MRSRDPKLMKQIHDYINESMNSILLKKERLPRPRLHQHFLFRVHPHTGTWFIFPRIMTLRMKKVKYAPAK